MLNAKIWEHQTSDASVLTSLSEELMYTYFSGNRINSQPKKPVFPLLQHCFQN